MCKQYQPIYLTLILPRLEVVSALGHGVGWKGHTLEVASGLKYECLERRCASSPDEPGATMRGIPVSSQGGFCSAVNDKTRGTEWCCL